MCSVGQDMRRGITLHDLQIVISRNEEILETLEILGCGLHHFQKLGSDKWRAAMAVLEPQGLEHCPWAIVSQSHINFVQFEDNAPHDRDPEFIS